MKRHEVTDDHWELVGTLISRKAASVGRRPRDPRLMLNGRDGRIDWDLCCVDGSNVGAARCALRG